MTARKMIETGINVKPPWSISNQHLDAGKHPNEVYLEVVADSHELYPCPSCGKKRQVRNMAAMVWRHQNFFEFPCYVVAQVPEIDCRVHGPVKVKVPWDGQASRLTVAQLAQARQPSAARQSLNRILNAGQIGMGADTCTKERVSNV